MVVTYGVADLNIFHFLLSLLVDLLTEATNFYFIYSLRLVIILFKWVYISLYFIHTPLESLFPRFLVFCMLCVFNLMSSLETITFGNNNCLYKYQLLCEFVSTFICENIKIAL